MAEVCGLCQFFEFCRINGDGDDLQSNYWRLGGAKQDMSFGQLWRDRGIGMHFDKLISSKTHRVAFFIVFVFVLGLDIGNLDLWGGLSEMIATVYRSPGEVS